MKIIRKPDFNFLIILLIISLMSACAPGGPASQGGQQEMTSGGFMFSTAWFIFCAFVVYWMLVIKPSADKEKSHAEFLKGLSKSDEVVTSGGILGRIHAVKSEHVAVEISPNVRIKVDRKHVFPVNKDKDEAKS